MSKMMKNVLGDGTLHLISQVSLGEPSAESMQIWLCLETVTMNSQELQ